jgi:hypothetical protein
MIYIEGIFYLHCPFPLAQSRCLVILYRTNYIKNIVFTKYKTITLDERLNSNYICHYCYYLVTKSSYIHGVKSNDTT